MGKTGKEIEIVFIVDMQGRSPSQLLCTASLPLLVVQVFDKMLILVQNRCLFIDQW
jgi:hypothetical protein